MCVAYADVIVDVEITVKLTLTIIHFAKHENQTLSTDNKPDSVLKFDDGNWSWNDFYFKQECWNKIIKIISIMGETME